MTARRHLIPDVVSGQSLKKLSIDSTAREAAKLMDGNQISSVLVVDASGRLRGIFTVRDVARRVVGRDRNPDTTPLSDVMTANVTCVAARETPQYALRLMQEGGFRHLPVTDDGTRESTLLGVVSRRSFFPEEEALLDYETSLWEHIR